MRNSSRDRFGVLLSIAGFALLVLSMMLFDRYSSFEEAGIASAIASWERTGLLWLGKWPIVGTIAAIGATLVIASPSEVALDRSGTVVAMASAPCDWTPGPRTPFSDTWTSATLRSDGGHGRILGS